MKFNWTGFYFGVAILEMLLVGLLDLLWMGSAE